MFTASLLLIALLSADVQSAPPPADDAGKVLVKKSGDALVTVQFVLKAEGAGEGGGDMEGEVECYGLLIDPNGLIVCSNSKLGGMSASVSQMLSAMGQNITAEPREIKIVVGQDGDEIPAELIARDGELDLAWLRMKTPPPADTPTVDLSQPAQPHLGQDLVALARAGRFLGRPALSVRTQLGGRVKKPRDMLLCTMRFNEPGVPVFADGRLLGLTVLQVPDADGGGDMNMAMGRLMSEIQAVGMLVLPTETIAKATTKALEEAKNKPTATSKSTD